MVGAITTWINPQGETLDALLHYPPGCRAACSEIRAERERDGVCSVWLRNVNNASGDWTMDQSRVIIT